MKKMKKLEELWDWGDLVVLFLTLVTYVPWAVIMGLTLSGIIKRVLML